MRIQEVRTISDEITDPLVIGGWLDGKNTFLWFGIYGQCIGTLSGQKLHRLAKAIVRRFEGE